MLPVAAIAGLVEAITLATSLISKISKDEMTPAEAAAEWDKTSSRWSNAVSGWKSTPAPDN